MTGKAFGTQGSLETAPRRHELSRSFTSYRSSTYGEPSPGHSVAPILTLRTGIPQGGREEVRDDVGPDMTVYLQVYVHATGSRAEFDPLSGSPAPAPHPDSESPDRIRRLKQRNKRRSIRTDCHDSIEGSSPEYGQGMSQALRLKVRNSIKRNSYSELLRNIIHKRIIPARQQ